MHCKLLIYCLFTACFGLAQDTIQTQIKIDSLGNEVYLIRDKSLAPIKFYSPVFTPVCVDGSCYPIHINLFWNLAGKYTHYSLKKGEVLTKVEHLPFTDFDYGLLHRMIEKSPSPLANFSIYELTSEGKSDVDGVSGATRPELNGSYVPDALFTTYTLWHLVRKPKEQMMVYTHDYYFNDKWEALIMKRHELGCQDAYMRMKSLDENDSIDWDIYFELLKKYDTHIELIPLEVLKKAKNTEYLIDYYQFTSNSNLKLSILEVFQSSPLNEKALKYITNEIGQCAACFATELKLIDDYGQWPDEEYDLFYNQLIHQRNMMRRNKMQEVLNKRSDQFPKKFRKRLKPS